MRYLSLGILFVCPLACAQNSENPALSALMSEVHELRLAVERSTLLGARTQIMIQRIQMQEGSAARASRMLDDARKDAARIQAERADMARVSKDLEAQLAHVQGPDVRREMENQIQSIRQRVADGAAEAQARGREAEALSQFQSEQTRLSQLQAEMSQMEGALDAAIRQITGGR